LSSFYTKTAHFLRGALLFLYAGSGLTSLAYEVLWARMLSLQFGVSTFGVVITVTAFMTGLGTGSLIGLHWANRTSRPLTVFAFLEIFVALYALLLPELLQTTSGWVERMAGQLSLFQWYGLQGSVGILLLAAPACAMGAGFPIMLKAARNHLPLKQLYGVNTLGAVVGALFPLWGLPALGWVASLRIIAFLSGMVGSGAFLLSHLVEATPGSSIGNSPRPPLRNAIFYAGIGAASLMLEIGWIRLYGLVLLRTEYVLGVILAVYLLGIGVGSLLAPRFSKPWLLTLLPLIAGTFTLLGLFELPAVSAWIEHHEFRSLSGALGCQALILAACTLPITLTLGLWLPLLANHLGNSEQSGVWLYGANAIGAGLGAILAGFVGIPFLGTTATVIIAGVAFAVLGLHWGKSRAAWLAIPVIIGCASPVWHLPPTRELLPQQLPGSQDLYFYEDMISTTHVVQQQNGQRLLLTDLQRMDASTDPAAVQIQKNQARLPLLLQPDPHKVLFLGIGTGISVAGSLSFPDLQRDAVEISEGAIVAANDWFLPANGNALLETTVYHDDARHFLNATHQQYDVIIGDLFHPDLAGLSSLLSIQQFRRARACLTESGVFVQWIALNQFDIQSFNAVLRGFQRVFPDGQLYMDGMHVALVGTKEKAVDAKTMARNLRRLTPARQYAATGGEGMWTWLGRYWGPIAEGTGTIQDEWTPFIEFRLPQARYAGELDVESLLNELIRQRPDVDSAMRMLEVRPTDRDSFERAYAASELITRAWIALFSDDDAEAVKLTWLAYQANPHDRWIAEGLADNMLRLLPQAGQHGLSERAALLRILRIDPTHTETLRALWHLERSLGNAREAEQYRLRLLAAAPLDREASTATMRSQ